MILIEFFSKNIMIPWKKKMEAQNQIKKNKKIRLC